MAGASGNQRPSSLKHGTWSALIMLLALTVPCPAAAVPTVYVDPPSSQVDPGEEFDVSVMITADADTFSNYRLFFTYDTDVIEFLTASEGSLYTHLLPGFWTWFGVEEESLGTWEVFDNVFPSGSYVLAPGELAMFSFRALADGYSPIHFLSVSVKDIDRYPLDPLEWQDGCVYVGPYSGVEVGGSEPLEWSLGYPFPNPAQGQTRISLALPPTAGAAEFDLAVYDIQGRRVRNLMAAITGGRDVEWDGRNDHGIAVPSGVYFFRLASPEKVSCRRVVMIR